MSESANDSGASLREVVMQSNVVADVKEPKCGLSSLGPRTAEVVAVVSSSRKMAASDTGPAIQSLDLILDEQSDGRWLVSKVNPTW